MKKTKILILIAAFLLLFVLASCNDNPPCTEHKDENGDGKCDVCETVICDGEHVDENGDGKCDRCENPFTNGGSLKMISLIEKDGNKLKANFQIVVADGISSDLAMKIDKLISKLSKLGVEVVRTHDAQNTTKNCEILIGEITSRGPEYVINKGEFGENGYKIKIINDKIVVAAGSNATLMDAFDTLVSNILRIEDSTTKLSELSVPTDVEYSVIQDDYKVNKLSLFDKDIRNYVISVNEDVLVEYSAAVALQKLLFEKCGYWLNIVTTGEENNAIVIRLLEKSGNEFFRVKASENNIAFECEYPSVFKTYKSGNLTKNNAACEWFLDKIENTVGSELNLTAKDNYEKNVSVVCYEEFGAVGDGKTEDADAIRNCHNYANDGNHTVRTNQNATYYIGVLEKTIIIETDVYWGNTKFIIDDACLGVGGGKSRTVRIFTVSRQYAQNSCIPHNFPLLEAIDAAGINAKECTKFDLGLGYPAMIEVVNSSHYNFIRHGVNENNGGKQTEVILVDAEGNIDPSTPFLFDYDNISQVIVYRTDETPLTIEGGIFTTIANVANSNTYTAYSRGISIERSNVTVRGMEHYIEGEGEKGHPYAYFHHVERGYNVLFEDCVYTAHKTYYNSKGAGNGSYDISAYYSINVVWRNCDTSNFLVSGHWGIMGSNGCKNLTYKDSRLSRFDAHAGIWNGTVEGGEIDNIRIAGGGTFTLKDVTVYSGSNLLELREDYGGVWHGDIVLDNVTFRTNSNTLTLISLSYWANWDFGYPTAMPTNIVIDNLKIQDMNGNAKTPTALRVFNQSFVTNSNNILKDEIGGVQNVNKMTPPATLTIKNNEQNLNFYIPDPNTYTYFKDMQVFRDEE